MAASFPSASCPVGPQCLSQFLLDPQVWALTWFIDAVCDTNNLRQAGWQQGNFWLLLLLQGLLEDTSVSAHLFLSVSKDNVFKEESRGLSSQTPQAEQKFHLAPLVFVFALQLCVRCNQFLPLMNWLSLHWRRFNSTIWVTEINCKTWQPEMLAATSPAFVWVKEPTCLPRNRLKW